MIVAITSVKDEEDILATNIHHLLANGVDRIIVSDGHSTDNTRDVGRIRGVTLLMQDGPFDQGAEITRLARLAHDAEWIIPFDADEFWIDPLGGTIATVLHAIPPHVTRIHCASFPHLDWDRKGPQKSMGKVAFRPHPEAQVEWGNHYVTNGDGEDGHGLLEIRELQYRSLAHLHQKTEKARQLFTSWEVPRAYGSHMRRLTELDEEGLLKVWNDINNREWTHDPIPLRGA